MRARFGLTPLALVLLGLAPFPAHAHGVPAWMFVAALSPVLVLVLIACYGWLARSLRAALVHASFLAAWVICFWLSSNHNQVTLLGISTDHVIWAALVLYLLHTLLVVILVSIYAIRRLKQKALAA
jgi:hypothetical protein